MKRLLISFVMVLLTFTFVVNTHIVYAANTTQNSTSLPIMPVKGKTIPKTSLKHKLQEKMLKKFHKKLYKVNAVGGTELVVIILIALLIIVVFALLGIDLVGLLITALIVILLVLLILFLLKQG